MVIAINSGYNAVFIVISAQNGISQLTQDGQRVQGTAQFTQQLIKGVLTIALPQDWEIIVRPQLSTFTAKPNQAMMGI